MLDALKTLRDDETGYYAVTARLGFLPGSAASAAEAMLLDAIALEAVEDNGAGVEPQLDDVLKDYCVIDPCVLEALQVSGDDLFEISLSPVAEVVPLTEVVIRAPHSWTTLRGALVGQGSVLKMSTDGTGFEILSCLLTLPVKRGRIVAATKLVFVEAPSSALALQPSPSLSSSSLPQTTSTPEESEDELAHDDELHFPDLMPNSPAKPKSSSKTAFADLQVSPLDRFPINQIKSPVDSASLILLPAYVLVDLGLEQGGFAVVEDITTHAKHIAVVYALDRGDNALASPLLLANIGVANGGKVRLSRAVINTAPSRVILSRVNTPSSDGHSDYSKYLMDFFRLPRLLKQSDLVAVPCWIDSDGKPLESHMFDATGRPLGAASQELVLFTVKQVELLSSNGVDMEISSDTAQIDDKTALLLQGSENRAAVASIDTYFLDTCSPKHLVPPPGQRGIFETIKRCIAPATARGGPSSLSVLHMGLAILLLGPTGSGRKTVANSVASHLGLHMLCVNAYDLLNETSAKSMKALENAADSAVANAPCVLYIDNFGALNDVDPQETPNKDPLIVLTLRRILVNFFHASSRLPVVFIAAVHELDEVPLGCQDLFLQEIKVEPPEEASRREILEFHLPRTLLAPDVSVDTLAIQTAALLPKDLNALANDAIQTAIKRILQQNVSSLEALVQAGVIVSSSDIAHALAGAHLSQKDAIGAPKIPAVTWADVGGLASVKSDIMDTIQLPLMHPHLFAKGLRQRSGILLYGPPGTGKTLLAKAVATEFSLNFLSVKGPELINMYVGESEKNVRVVFEKARNAKPCVIFFDELDSLAPNRGNQGDSGGVMDRIVSQLLAELDGANTGSSGEIFVIGATNRPDLIDPALLRPGRFDKLIYLSVSEDNESQLKILLALTRKFRLHADLNLGDVVQKIPFNYTGADFYALCTDAMMNGIKRRIQELEGELEDIKKSQPTLTMERYLGQLPAEALAAVLVADDFYRAINELVPSVSPAELDRYRKLQQSFTQESTGRKDKSADV